MNYIRFYCTVIIVVYFTGLSFVSPVFSQEQNPDTVAVTPINLDDIIVENNAFSVGEKLTFSVDYGPIQAGTAIMSVEDTTTIRGRSCYHITSKAFSSNSFSVFFKVEDIIESFIDTRGIFSARIEKHIHEGSFNKDEWYEFNYPENKAYSEKDTVLIPAVMQDALSALYYLRTQELKVGKSIKLSHFDNGKIHKLEVKVLKRETIKVKAGIFRTILVEPMMTGIGVFKHGGQIRVWLTNDKKKMPVKMTTKIYLGSIGLGSIGANLTSYEGTK